MKYIRTCEGKIIDVEKAIQRYKNNESLDDMALDIIARIVYGGTDDYGYKRRAIKEADTIEELCDYYVIFDSDGHCDITRDYGYFIEMHADAVRHCSLSGTYGALRTDTGLIYVAKMNDKGEWELL